MIVSISKPHKKKLFPILDPRRLPLRANALLKLFCAKSCCCSLRRYHLHFAKLLALLKRYKVVDDGAQGHQFLLLLLFVVKGGSCAEQVDLGMW